MADMRSAYKTLGGKFEGMIPHGRYRHRCESNTDLRESVDWIHLAQDRDQWQALVNTIMSLRNL
jgi:hypothetical protein